MQYLKISLLSAAVAALSVACVVNEVPDDDQSEGSGASGQGASSGSGETTNNGAGAGSSTSGGGVFECCINGAGYSCPDGAAVDQCLGFDIDGCMAACSFDDFDCQDACFDAWDSSTPDPSACTPDANATCEGGGGGGGGLCIGDWDGAMCSSDGDCASFNCVDNKCYAKADGNPCSSDGDCDSFNCFEGCCYSKSAGSPCSSDGDCDSFNCYDNVCQ